MVWNPQMWVFKEKNIYIVSWWHAETESFLYCFTALKGPSLKSSLKSLSKAQEK